MPRYRLTIAYDGTDFFGWQRQTATEQDHPGVLEEASGPNAHPETGEADPRPQLRTVQEVLQRAVREVVREPVEVVGASRTDSGVHAAAQCAAFTTSDDRRGPSDDRLAVAINARLPEDCVIRRAEIVSDEFDPIADCVSKGYRYTIFQADEDEPRPLWDRRYVHPVRARLDFEAMREAAGALVGEHDFAAFTNAGHGRLSTVREVLRCAVTRLDDRRLAIDVSGAGFLYNMVRIMAGALVEVGRGKRTVGDLRAALESGDRAKSGPTLPPTGLRLEWIRYPDALLGTEP